MAERYDYDLDENLNLYLDGRLSGEKLEAFERRVQSDPKLRRAVEFHRGLTLDFREETPTLPPGYAQRARARLQADPGTAREPRRPFWFASPASLRILATAGAMLVVALILWPVARRAISPASDALNMPDAIDRGAAGIQEAGQPDEETLEALRSLGYISSGSVDTEPAGKQPTEPAGKQATDAVADKASGPTVFKERAKKLSQKTEAETERRPDAVARESVERPQEEMKQEEMKKALAEQDPKAVQRDAPAEPSEPAGGLFFARKTATVSADAAGERLAFQILSVGRAPELGRDHEVIAAAGAWSTLFEGSGEEPPAVDFTRQRAVLLREALGSEPPARLSVETIAVQAGMLVITCRVERPMAADDATFAPGQIVLVPAGDLPIRVVILP